MSLLVVFAGRPGCGKTAVSRPVADALGATFLRIDTIEVAITTTLAPVLDSPVGYVAASWVAADQLRAGRPVVADAVNNVGAARAVWTDLARDCGVPLHFVEVICSDRAEHRRRIVERRADLPGHAQPTWDEVRSMPWEPFLTPRLVVDNLGDRGVHVNTVLAWLTGGGTSGEDPQN